MACTENQRAKNLGGNMTIRVPYGHKVTNITWKEAELWYSYRPMRPGEVAEKTIFRENSSFGILEGTVTFIEKR
jgi:hypothetical protein